MKNAYRVTRPAWAAMERWETGMIFIAGLALGIFGYEGHELLVLLLADLKPSLRDAVVKIAWPIVGTTATTIGCLLLMWFYKRHRVGCYPSTFLYCFNLPAEAISSPTGRSQVAGYCHIRPDMERGELIAEGASFLWEHDQLNLDSRVGFRSTDITGTCDDDGITGCQITYNINKDDLAKRYYRHGALHFQYLPSERSRTGRDNYAGYFESLDDDNVERHGKGYAQWCMRGRLQESTVLELLSNEGGQLFAKLAKLLTAPSQPVLWQNKHEEPMMYSNKWGLKIPTPQTAILSEKLKPFIDSYLTDVLKRHGFEDVQI